MKLPAPRSRFWGNVFAVAYKEAMIVRHDRAFLAMVLLQPLTMFLILGYVLTTKPANVPWAVLDRDSSSVSRRLVAEIQATGAFLPPVFVHSYDEGRGLLGAGKALAFVVIPRDFRRRLERGSPDVQLLLDGADPLSAARVASYVAGVTCAFGPARRLLGRTMVVASHAAPRPVRLRQRFWFNPTLDEHRFFIAALAGMLLTNICLSATSLGLVAERESGTYEQMLAQPTRALELVLGKLVPYVVLSYVVLLVATIAGGIFFGLWPAGGWVPLLAVTLPFVLSSLAIGAFVSSLARSSAQAVFISVFFILPSFVLSGVLLPYQLMPHGIREVGGIFPLRWYQIALRRVIERGAGLGDIVVPAVALAAIFAVLLAAIRWRMKPRLG